MKKLIILLFLTTSTLAYEDVPVIPQDISNDIQYSQYQQIELKDMKRKNTIEQGQLKAKKNQNKKLYIDTEPIIQQRALDYTTGRNNNGFLPRF